MEIGKAGEYDVLQVARFDRIPGRGKSAARLAAVSALTLLGLDESLAGHASYQSLAEIIRQRFVSPRRTLRELFGRICFNILFGNTDDHGRNHAACWDGKDLRLAPAYDICPQPRRGGEAVQAMIIANDGRRKFSSLALLLETAGSYLLDEVAAARIAGAQITAIGRNWSKTCRQAGLARPAAEHLAHRSFLQSFAFEGLPEKHRSLARLAEKTRGALG